MKPTGERCAQVAIDSLSKGISYGQMDCQTYMEWCVKQAGGKMDYTGSNAMARACHNAGTMMTLAEAKKQKKLVKGAFVFIHEATGEPDKYKNDGLGNYSHVGMYVGENAVQDTDKNGKLRLCNVMHSSQTMGRVAGSTTANGFTHVGWMPEIDYGSKVEADFEVVEVRGDGMWQMMANCNVNVREGRGTDKRKVGLINKGSVVNVYEQEKEWIRINYNDELAGWCKADLFTPIKGSTVKPSEPAEPSDYISREEFEAVISAMNDRIKVLQAEIDMGE